MGDEAGCSAGKDTGFFQKVCAAVRRVPCGRVVTYGQVAAACGSPRMARFVGYALHVNPEPGVIPCHRVVFKDGSLAPGFALGGPDAQRELLAEEGVAFLSDGRVDLSACGWEFGPEEPDA